jgi:PAS domain S-box-containing protein
MEPVGAHEPISTGLGFLRGAGAAGELIRGLGDDNCPLGPPEGWSATLRGVLRTVLPSQAQIAVFWGADDVALYNNAFALAMGSTHPRAMGRPGRESWPEMWKTVQPLLDEVRRTGETFHAQDYPFVIDRDGYLEEVFFDISYSALHEAGDVAGIMAVVTETTGRVMAHRRLRALSATNLRLAAAETPEAACGAVLRTMAAEDPADLPWGRIVLRRGDALVELAGGPAPTPEGAQLRGVMETGLPAELDIACPDGTTARALAKPLMRGGTVAGVFLAGLNPHVRLAGDYGGFLDLVAGQLSLALTRLGQQEEERRAAERLRESEARFRNMADNAPVMIWVTDPDGRCTYLSRHWYDFTGQTEQTGLGFGWLDAVHPEDVAKVRAAMERGFAEKAGFQIEYRLCAMDGRHVWVIDAATPRFGEDGRFAGFIGSVLDISDRRRAEEAQQLLSRELSHRIKNVFMVTGGLAALTARGDPAAEAFAARLQERLRALSLAHDIVRPALSTTGTQRSCPTMHGLLHTVLAPYRDPRGEQVSIAGEDGPLGYAAANALALILHEQATNAVKYGALSQAGGHVRIATRLQDGAFHLEWREEGGPAIAGAPARRGFGTALAARNIAGQLQGRMTHDWRRDGLVMRLEIPAALLAQ